ncbi:XRE family transcriptional regulator [Streptomyces eurocidicus]|uniref:Transcriptional regulator with XRE-family HTH domain n=1 Tax=Streptomyces eurocidicus TaxID=66423 RepID=A0A2N8P380_STREU|nr:helix-turn-helix transcriptional regulator [Streptomyces eurocidicus]MBB5117660.1 transcriptional regulator with XRE-family HTH domain [Streptomyces eurocidicus]MBF6053497.1 helix-turn-helix domain-containing protein [Streptomyces eurocidicus]PNE35473.1 XRE family transcriptional regulator [Streptomyces eurocidicus]
MSPNSNAQATRAALAEWLKEIRQDAGLTGQDLADRCGWHKAKSSRIENAKTTPSDADIQAWCRACGAADQAADLIAANRTADSLYVQWKRLHRTGLRRIQESYVPLYEQTRHFRVYCSSVVPGFLQTEAYATALLSSIASFRQAPDDVADAVAARLTRSRVIHDGNRRFAMLVEESVLRYRLGDAEAMAGQLGYLLSAMSLPAVSLGVIPFQAARSVWPMATFNVFDDKQAAVDLLTAQVTVTAPGEVAMYVKAFADLQRHAVYGSRARSLIKDALDTLE